MAEAPYMPLYVGDYLGDTQHLTTEQHGAYLLLLMTMWRSEGSLPNDPAKLARIARVSLRRWPQIALEVMPFFHVDGDHIHQKRLNLERQKVLSISEKRSVSGKAGSEAKAAYRNALKETPKPPYRIDNPEDENSSKSLENNNTHEANASVLLKQTASIARAYHTKPEPEPEKRGIDSPSDSIPRKRSSTKTSLFLENPDFERFWEQFPKKTGIGTARKIYDRIVMEGIATPQDLLAGAMRYSEQRSGEDERYTKSPENWLNGECWLDEAPPQRPRTETKSGYVSPVDAIMAGAKSYFKTGEPE